MSLHQAALVLEPPALRPFGAGLAGSGRGLGAAQRRVGRARPWPGGTRSVPRQHQLQQGAEQAASSSCGVGSPRNVRYKRFPYQLLTCVSTDRKGVILFGSVLFSRTSFNGDVAGGCHSILRSLSCFKRRNGPSTCGVHLSQIMQFANRLDQFGFF